MIVLSVSLASAVPAASGAVVTLLSTNGSSQNWTTAANWSNNASPTADNTYLVNIDKIVRSPRDESATFGGASLTIDGTLILQAGTGFTSTVGTLAVNGEGSPSSARGAIGAASPSILAGTNLSFSGSVYVDSSTSNSRRAITLNYNNFSGSGNVLFDGRGILTLNTQSTSYTGNWSIGGANSNSTSQPGELVALADGSLGTGNIAVNNNGRLSVKYDFSGPDSTLALAAATGGAAAGTVVLDHDLIFGAVNIGGSFLPVGTHSFADLNGAYDQYFVDGGSGSITVVPEPGMIGAAAMGVAARGIARRRRSPSDVRRN